MTADSDLETKLKETLDEAEWSWIKPHAIRDVVIVVANELDLLDTAVLIATNDAERIGGLISSGKIGKPTAGQIAAWDQMPAKKFLCVVVQPFVVVQEHLQN